LLLSAGLISTAIASCSVASAPHAPSGIKCTLEQVNDTEKSGVVAFTYLVPEGWTPHHMMKWGEADSYVANLSASTADKSYSVDQLEPMVMSFMSMRAGNPRGIHIAQATDFLHSLVELIKKQYNVSKVDIVDEVNETLPLTPFQEAASKTNWGPMQTRTPFHESGYLKATFELNGKEVTVEMGTTVVGTNVRMHALNDESQETSTSGVYRVGPTMTIITPSSPEPAKVKEAKIIAASMHPTAEFVDYRQKLTASLAQAQLNANEAELNAKNSDWHERSMAEFRGQMAAKDANTHQFCNYILDQQDYQSKGGPTVTLPSGYKHAWTDGNGKYLLSDDSSSDSQGGNWEPLEKKAGG
jgi:hypothetical protein